MRISLKNGIAITNLSTTQEEFISPPPTQPEAEIRYFLRGPEAPKPQPVRYASRPRLRRRQALLAPRRRRLFRPPWHPSAIPDSIRCHRQSNNSLHRLRC